MRCDDTVMTWETNFSFSWLRVCLPCIGVESRKKLLKMVISTESRHYKSYNNFYDPTGSQYSVFKRMNFEHVSYKKYKKNAREKNSIANEFTTKYANANDSVNFFPNNFLFSLGEILRLKRPIHKGWKETVDSVRVMILSTYSHFFFVFCSYFLLLLSTLYFLYE